MVVVTSVLFPLWIGIKVDTIALERNCYPTKQEVRTKKNGFYLPKSLSGMFWEYLAPVFIKWEENCKIHRDRT